jgi:hypothetical protein
MESIYKPSEVPKHMNIDTFFIDGEGYLISVLTPLDYVMISRIKNRASEALRATDLLHYSMHCEQQDTLSTQPDLDNMCR